MYGGRSTQLYLISTFNIPSGSTGDKNVHVGGSMLRNFKFSIGYATTSDMTLEKHSVIKE